MLHVHVIHNSHIIFRSPVFFANGRSSGRTLAHTSQTFGLKLGGILISTTMSSVPERRPFLGIVQEQLGYVHCYFCTSILLVSSHAFALRTDKTANGNDHKYLLSSQLQVSVPSSCGGGSLQLRTVAVQCGNCAGVLSVTLPPPPPVELPLQVRSHHRVFLS
ncbi:hypothetical protein EJB05_11696, partial [Eragrostis curvula]